MDSAKTAAANPSSSILDLVLCERSRRILLLMIAIWVMNLFDLALTIQAHEQGLLVESNPIAHAILPYGPMAISLFKIVLVAFGSYVLIHHRKRILVEYLSWLVVAVYVGVSLQWMFCYEAYDLIVATEFYDPVDNLMG